MPKARGGIWCGCPTCGPSRLLIPVGRYAVKHCGALWDTDHLKLYKEGRRERTGGDPGLHEVDTSGAGAGAQRAEPLEPELLDPVLLSATLL